MAVPELLPGSGGRPLRILRIIARLNIGGPARHAALLHSELARRGHRTSLLFGALAPSEGSFESLLGSSAASAVRIERFSRALAPVDDLRTFIEILRHVFVFRPDVVHTHTAKAGALGRVAATVYNVTRRRANRCLVVHTFHGHVLHGYFGPVGSEAARVVERILAKCTDRIVAISGSQASELSGRYRVASDDKVVVVPLGLSLDELFRLSPGRDGACQELQCLYVGRLVPIKDLGTMLRGVALAIEAGVNVRLTLVGDGQCREELQQLAIALSLSGRIEFSGWKTDLAEIYARADVVLLTSITEGTPVAAIEAMAAGRPVIATDVGGVRDIVESERTGLLVPPRSPEMLAEALSRLASDPDLRAAMGEAGRAIARTRFGGDRLVTDVERLYEEGICAKRSL